MQQIPPDEANGPFPDQDAPAEVEPGIWRIPLPLPFALRSANVYLISGDGEHVLVDCGLGTHAGEAALRAGLAWAGISMDAVTTLVLTHAHPDHIGQAGPVHAASGAAVRMLADEAERLYYVWGDPRLTALRETNEMYAAHGMPPADLDQTLRSNQAVSRAIHLAPASAVTPLTDGQTLRLAGQSFRALWTPGHSDYHLCLLREDGLLIAGDHVLPRITPNIGVYPNARPNPLRDYRESLMQVRDLPVRLALPGHGLPFTDWAGRVDEILAHHVARAAQTLAALATHATSADAYTLASDLFGGRLRGADDHRFALVETLAHLEDLRERGQVERIERGGHVKYALAAAVARAERA